MGAGPWPDGHDRDATGSIKANLLWRAVVPDRGWAEVRMPACRRDWRLEMLKANELRAHAQDVIDSNQRREEARKARDAESRRTFMAEVESDPEKYIEIHFASEIRRKAQDGKFEATLYEHRDWPELIELLSNYFQKSGFKVTAERLYHESGPDVNSEKWVHGYHYYVIQVEW